MTDTTFTAALFDTISATTASMNVSGTVSENEDNLFKTLTVTTASGTDAPSAGVTALALELIGSSTFIVPFDSNNPLVATVQSTCPSSDFVANWVVTRPGIDSGVFAPSNLTSDGAGIATYNADGDTFLVQSSGITDGVLASPAGSTPFDPFGMGDCASGRLAVDQSSERFDMYFTPTGQIVVKFPAAMGEQIISGFPRTESAVTAASLNGVYSVLLYRGGTPIALTGATVRPAKLTLSAGSGSITVITSADDNTEASTAAFSVGSFSATDDGSTALSNGLFRLQLSGGSDGNGNGKLTCATTDATPKVIACYGFYNTGGNTDNERRPITLLGRMR